MQQEMMVQKVFKIRVQSKYLTWSARCLMIDVPISGQESTFTITDTRFYVPVIPLSTRNQVLKEQLTGMSIIQK